MAGTQEQIEFVSVTSSRPAAPGAATAEPGVDRLPAKSDGQSQQKLTV